MGLKSAFDAQLNAFKEGYAFVDRHRGDAGQAWIEGLAHQSALNPDGYVAQAKKQGIQAIPGYVLGRLAGDILADGTRKIYWLGNNAMALNSLATDYAIGPELRNYSVPASMREPNKKYYSSAEALLPQFAVQSAFAVANGYYDPRNAGELGRLSGFQAVVPTEEDKRKTENPLAEVFSRYFMGRTGKLLPYDEFKKERPDIDLETYNNYQRFLNQDKGFLGMGLLKGTMEGLDEPEARILGSRVALSGAATGIGGAIGIGVGQSLTPKNRFAGAMMGALIGSTAGFTGGKALNLAIQANKDAPVVPQIEPESGRLLA